MVVGGGMAGVCSAITAARAGLRVVLVQDRPVLGGNASSEVRLWMLGATVHMGTNNRWAREGGVVNEIMMENLWRNPEGNALIFDTILLEKVYEEKSLTLLLNTACFEVSKAGGDRIQSISALCSQNETLYRIDAPLFCDASGDGVLGFLAGAAFRMGAEPKAEFGERFAPEGEFGFLLGHSIYFYSKDTGRPVKFVAPSYALQDVEKLIPRFRDLNATVQGCQLWWLEWGGRLDTIHDTEKIKWELWKIVYGVWNYIKNSGRFPDAGNLTLEWVGLIPGKRESRRFEGDYILTQPDIVERRRHADGVAYGGWSIDLHPAEGVFAEIAGSHHLHSKGPYQIPYRCYYSRNIPNLFLAGRIISCSHVAFGSTRVMATCALGGQAVGEAAAMCVELGEEPRGINAPERMAVLHQRLSRAGHHVPAIAAPDPMDICSDAEVRCSSELALSELPPGGPERKLDRAIVQMIPVQAGRIPIFTVAADSCREAEIEVELLGASDGWHHTPDVLLARRKITIPEGQSQQVPIDFAIEIDAARYVFLRFPEAEEISLQTSPLRVTGLLLSTYRKTESTEAVGGEHFDVYAPDRRPGGHNLALKFHPPLAVHAAENLRNGWQRPTNQPNAWVASIDDAAPEVTVSWDAERVIAETVICFDGDFDHSMESVLWGHPERAVVFCVKKYEIVDDSGRVLASVDDNHQSHVSHRWSEPVKTRSLTLRILETWGAPASVFEIRCY